MSSDILLLARPPRPRWRMPVAVLFVLATMAGGLADVVTPADAATVTFTVESFVDDDRDGHRDADEGGWDNQVFYLFTTDGQFVQGVATGPDGTAQFAGVPAATYDIAMNSTDWGAIRHDWTPTTPDSLRPEARVDVADGGALSFGWRPITWSSDPAAPMSETVHASGVTIRSYNDAVTADDVAEVLSGGSAIGDEAPTVDITYGLTDVSYTSSGSEGVPGLYANFEATIHLSHTSWLTAPSRTLFHEYGHAWAGYRERIVNQWSDLTPYLEVRGISPDDDRLGSSHAWSVGEMIAEDYRQLFGDAAGAAHEQENREIAAAADVPGLRDWLIGEFSTGGSTGTDDATSDTTEDPTSEPAPEPLAIESLDVVSPAVDVTTLTLDVTRAATADVFVRDERGKTVAIIVDGMMLDDVDSWSWGLADDRGHRVKDGTYEVVASVSDGEVTDTATATVVVETAAEDDTSPGGGKNTNGKGPKH